MSRFHHESSRRVFVLGFSPRSIRHGVASTVSDADFTIMNASLCCVIKHFHMLNSV